MTWTITSRGSPYETGSSSAPITSDAFTPADGSLVLAAIIHTGAASDITGGTKNTDSTLAQITSLTVNTTKTLQLWAGIVGTGTNSAITLTRNAMERCGAVFFELNETAGFPSPVANCFGTPDNNEYAGSTGDTGSLAAFAQSTNLTLIVAGNPGYDGANQYTPDTGFSELVEADLSTAVASLAIHTRDSEDTTPSISVNYSSIYGFIYVEVKANTASGPDVSYDYRLVIT